MIIETLFLNYLLLFKTIFAVTEQECDEESKVCYKKPSKK
jgi:hypothetical protein